MESLLGFFKDEGFFDRSSCIKVSFIFSFGLTTFFWRCTCDVGCKIFSKNFFVK